LFRTISPRKTTVDKTKYVFSRRIAASMAEGIWNYRCAPLT
jgi:hypothetical protein